MTCTDYRCTDGITMCRGCNGYGVLRHSGRKFTMRGKGRYITDKSPKHDDCSGTGLMECGCVTLDATTRELINAETP